MSMAIAFLGGLATESLSVWWVYCATRGWTGRLALVGGLQGLAHVAGLGSAIQGVPAAVAYVAGHAIGPVVGLLVANYLEGRGRTNG